MPSDTTTCVAERWLNSERTPQPACPIRFWSSYRFRVIPCGEPSRTETVGRFQIETIAENFFIGEWKNGQPVIAATARFDIRHKGRLVTLDVAGDPQEGGADGATATAAKPLPPRAHRVQAVATLPGLPTALLVRVEVPATKGQRKPLRFSIQSAWASFLPTFEPEDFFLEFPAAKRPGSSNLPHTRICPCAPTHSNGLRRA